MLDFKEEKDLFKKFDEIVDSETSLFLGVSGGADSMFMYHLVKKYFIKNKLAFGKMRILHFNHKYRPVSDVEEKELKKFFDNECVSFIVGRYDGKDFTENALRKARHSFFESNLINSGKGLLLLGHNLNDRIETTFLNMMRGCHIDGIKNMRIIDLKKFETSTDKLEYYKVFRPLLSFSKDYILFLCKHNHIRFYQDLSNFDENLSKRNQIRKTISNIIANSNFEKDSSLFYSSFQNLYDFLEQDRQSSDQNSSKLSKMIVSNYWNAKRAYVLDGEILETQDLVQLLKKLGIYKNITKQLLNELFEFISKSSGGYKYIGGVYIFKLHKKIYLINAPKDFWQKEIELNIKINKIPGSYSTQDFEIYVEEKELFGGKIRFRKQGDRFNGKKLNRYFIDKKIPLFWRNYIPLIEKDGKILYVFDDNI